jgi:FXSXX-COOH protein
MGDVGEGVLIDVSRVSLHDLLDEVDESALARALDRILAPERDDRQYAFNSSIM